MGNLPVRPNAQPNQEFQDLLQQGKTRLANKLATGPTEGEQFADFASLVGAGFQGGNEFRAEDQRQTGNQFAQDEQLRQLLVHEDNLDMAQREQQRLQLKQIQEQELAAGSVAADLIQRLTAGNPRDEAKLVQAWLGALSESGQDDDNLDPQIIQDYITKAYQQLQAAGEIEGPPAETMTPGAPLMKGGEHVGNVPLGTVDQPAIDAELKAAQDLEAFKAGLEGDETDEAKPDNYRLKDGTVVLSYDHKTYADPTTGIIKGLPSDAVRMGRESAVTETRIEEARQTAVKESEKDSVGALKHPQQRDMVKAAEEGGVGVWSSFAAAIDSIIGGVELNKVFGGEGSMFPQTTKNRQYLKTLKQLGKVTFVNNPRFPVAEQNAVNDLLPDPDIVWQNPGTTAQDVVTLRELLGGWKQANNEIIATSSLDAKTLNELIYKNSQIDRMLAFMGSGAQSGTGLSTDDESFLEEMNRTYIE